MTATEPQDAYRKEAIRYARLAGTMRAKLIGAGYPTDTPEQVDASLAACKIAGKDRPWEGVDGHLWLRDLYVALYESNARHSVIAYALSKPWKYRAEVEAYRSAADV